MSHSLRYFHCPILMICVSFAFIHKLSADFFHSCKNSLLNKEVEESNLDIFSPGPSSWNEQRGEPTAKVALHHPGLCSSVWRPIYWSRHPTPSLLPGTHACSSFLTTGLDTNSPCLIALLSFWLPVSLSLYTCPVTLPFFTSFSHLPILSSEYCILIILACFQSVLYTLWIF